MSDNRLIFFATRKQARDYAKENGLNTRAVVDLGTSSKIGERWALNLESVLSGAKEVDVTTSEEKKKNFSFKVGLNIVSEKLNKLFGY